MFQAVAQRGRDCTIRASAQALGLAVTRETAGTLVVPMPALSRVAPGKSGPHEMARGRLSLLSSHGRVIGPQEAQIKQLMLVHQ